MLYLCYIVHHCQSWFVYVIQIFASGSVGHLNYWCYSSHVFQSASLAFRSKTRLGKHLRVKSQSCSQSLGFLYFTLSMITALSEILLVGNTEVTRRGEVGGTFIGVHVMFGLNCVLEFQLLAHFCLAYVCSALDQVGLSARLPIYIPPTYPEKLIRHSLEPAWMVIRQSVM